MIPRALVVVDFQNDFVTGSLAVTGAMRAVNGVNRLINSYVEEWNSNPKYSFSGTIPIFYSMDWHRPDHPSFKPYGGEWPVHCVAGTVGAALYPDIALVPGSKLVLKGQVDECYSALPGLINGTGALTLEGWLHLFGVQCVDVCGLALDYCVKQTALDAAKAGFKVNVHMDATAAVSYDNVDSVEKEFAEAGIMLW